MTALSGPVAVQSISLTAVVTWLPSSSTSGGVAADLMVAAVTLDPGPRRWWTPVRGPARIR
ncbi:MAG TPA: hypothetical protein VL652_39020 [Kutzneria sp.]|nr:hypothetical protein [Kutzneria sp.]